MKRNIHLFILLITGILLFSGCSGNKNPNNMVVTREYMNFTNLGPKLPFAPRHYICYRTSLPLFIDGKPDETAWEKAPWTEDFGDIEGKLKPDPLYKTRVKMLWDDNYLYIAAELEEPEVWARLRQRDTVIFYDNDFEVFIDPDGDTHNYYEFEMNAFGTEWDLLLTKPYRDEGTAVFAWDIYGIIVATDINGTINDPDNKDEGWTLEIAMPWEILKEFAPEGEKARAGDKWRINFSRVEWTYDIVDGKYVKRSDPKTGKPLPENNWVWSPQGLINMHFPEMWGFLLFSDKIAGEGTEEYYYEKDEDIKWVLRQMYYLEKDFYEKNDRYTLSMKELGVNSNIFIDLPGIPRIDLTKSLFEIWMPGFNKGEIWHINNEGRTWCSH